MNQAREYASDNSYISPYIEEAAKEGKVKSPLGAFAKTLGMTPKARTGLGRAGAGAGRLDA